MQSQLLRAQRAQTQLVLSDPVELNVLFWDQAVGEFGQRGRGSTYSGVSTGWRPWG